MADEQADGARARAREKFAEARRQVAPGEGWRRSVVVFVVVALLAVGLGRRWLQAWRARRAFARLADPDVTPEEVEAVAQHGRGGLIDLFRLLGTSPKPEVRAAAGRALAMLWGQDQLIAEEERAIVSRGYQVDWSARRRYPRGMTSAIPVVVDFGVPFLADEEGSVGPRNLEWSYKIAGAERAALETFSPWTAGPGHAQFSVDPADFPSNGPYRLAFAAKARTVGLTSHWELSLPHVPFHFEFDPNLKVEALLTQPDEARAAALTRAVTLAAPNDSEEARFLPIDEEFAIRNPPALEVATPLPSDLAHAVEVEIEGVTGRFAAGTIVVAGGGGPGVVRFPVGPVAGLSLGTIDRPGERRIRALLTADPDRGWAAPDIRSIWPGTLITDWVTVRLIRR